MDKIGIVGIGRMGLCLALNFERKNIVVYGVDSNSDYIDALNSKSIETIEASVEHYLRESKNLYFSTELKSIIHAEINMIFICVPTPSKRNGSFDHSIIDNICKEISVLKRPKNEINLIVKSTVMPGYCDKLHKKMSPFGYSVSYNPEFIAQGSIIENQQFPDQVLIGESNKEVGNKLESIYRYSVQNIPSFSRMSRIDAEITKLAINCFLTTKVAFANSIGDLTIKYAGNQDKVLQAIGLDKRIGTKYLTYGYGYGGPCLPRDNRALREAAKKVTLDLPISKATDKSNRLHLHFQQKIIEQDHSRDEQIIFSGLTYKTNSDIIEDSQSLQLALELAKVGYNILLKDRVSVIDQIKAIHKDLFAYEVLNDE